MRSINYKARGVTTFDQTSDQLELGVKTCSKCKTELPDEAFTRSRGKLASSCKKCHSKSVIKYQYKITFEEHVAMIEDADGKCGICSRERQLVIDHDHSTGEARGLLCYSCNNALGMFQDSADVLEAAIKYLRQGGDLK